VLRSRHGPCGALAVRPAAGPPRALAYGPADLLTRSADQVNAAAPPPTICGGTRFGGLDVGLQCRRPLDRAPNSQKRRVPRNWGPRGRSLRASFSGMLNILVPIKPFAQARWPSFRRQGFGGQWLLFQREQSRRSTLAPISVPYGIAKRPLLP